MSEQVHQIGRAIQTARCTSGPIVDGAACDDVQAELIHVSLVEMPESAEKKKLLAIPTGLTLQAHDADLLVAAGETAVTTSEPLRRFLDNYPPQVAPPRPVRAPSTAATSRRQGGP